jgi:hypothetical protein
VSFQFAQVGDDRKAEEFLAALDAHPKVGPLIDSTGNYEMESAQFLRVSGQSMDPSLWIIKMLLGACDSVSDVGIRDDGKAEITCQSYDTKDERVRR